MKSDSAAICSSVIRHRADEVVVEQLLPPRADPTTGDRGAPFVERERAGPESRDPPRWARPPVEDEPWAATAAPRASRARPQRPRAWPQVRAPRRPPARAARVQVAGLGQDLRRAPTRRRRRPRETPRAPRPAPRAATKKPARPLLLLRRQERDRGRTRRAEPSWVLAFSGDGRRRLGRRRRRRSHGGRHGHRAGRRGAGRGDGDRCRRRRRDRGHRERGRRRGLWNAGHEVDARGGRGRRDLDVLGGGLRGRRTRREALEIEVERRRRLRDGSLDQNPLRPGCRSSSGEGREEGAPEALPAWRAPWRRRGGRWQPGEAVRQRAARENRRRRAPRGSRAQMQVRPGPVLPPRHRGAGRRTEAWPRASASKTPRAPPASRGGCEALRLGGRHRGQTTERLSRGDPRGARNRPDRPPYRGRGQPDRRRMGALDRRPRPHRARGRPSTAKGSCRAWGPGRATRPRPRRRAPQGRFAHGGCRR